MMPEGVQCPGESMYICISWLTILNTIYNIPFYIKFVILIFSFNTNSQNMTNQSNAVTTQNSSENLKLHYVL